MYQSIWELPTIVLNSLNEEDATKWMTAYNECNPRNNDEARKAKRKAWHSVAKAPSSFSFEIIASTDTIDRAKDIIDLDSTKKHMDSFIDYGGNIQNDHHNYTVGTIWDWKPCKVKDDKNREVDGIIAYGNLFGGDLVYDNIRRSFVNGMNKLSIAGEAAPGKYQCDERGCYTRRNVQQLLEISLCVEPMNKYCTLVDYNKGATIKKSASAFNLRIQEYTLHKDTAACPIMSLKKSLTAIGYDAHAREDGVHIPMTFMEFIDDEDNFRKHGLNIDYNGKLGEAVVTRGFTRANKAVQLLGREEGQKIIDENENNGSGHRKGLHLNFGLMSDEEGQTPMKFSTFNPELFNLVTSWGGRPYSEGLYEGLLKPNKHKFKEKKQLSDAQMVYATGDDADTSGFVTNLYPGAKILNIRSLNDWYKLFDSGRYQTRTGHTASNGTYWDINEIFYPSLLKDYDMINFDLSDSPDEYDEVPKGAFMSRRNPDEKKRDKFSNPTTRTNYRFLLNPYAVMSSEVYDGKQHTIDGVSANKVSPRTEEWRPWNRAATLDKLRQRYKDMGIEVDW